MLTNFDYIYIENLLISPGNAGYSASGLIN